MDALKQAFDKVKQDILSLKQEIKLLRQEINALKQEKNQKFLQNMPVLNPTNQTQNPTIHTLDSDNPTDRQTIKQPLEPLKPLNLGISTGNRGVPTDKQTNRQTIQQTDKTPIFKEFEGFKYKSDDFEKATEILDSLDSLKKEIRLKFKRLTTQEMAVFSALYSLEEQHIDEITYKIIANNLGLSESSIRDYITKLINKGIPVMKIRQNNKKITLRISPDLQKIASLSTIMKLREL